MTIPLELFKANFNATLVLQTFQDLSRFVQAKGYVV